MPCTFNSPVVAGHAIIAIFGSTFNGREVTIPPGITDSLNNNWALCIQNQGANRDLEVWYDTSANGGTTAVTTPLVTSGGASEILLEVSNLSGNNCDQFSIASGTSTGGNGLTPYTGTTDNLSQTNEFVLAMMTKNTTAAVATNPAGFTTLTPVTTNAPLFASYFVAGSTNGQAALWTVGTPVNWSANIVTFRGSNTAMPAVSHGFIFGP